MLYKNRAIFPNQRKNSFHAEQNHERIEVAIVLFHLALKLEQVGHKILAINDGNGLVHHILHLDFVLVGDIEIDGLHRLRYVQFTAHARLIDAVPIVDAVGSVGSLLNLRDHDVRAKGMNTPRRDEKDIARFNLLIVQHITQSIVLHHFDIIHPSHFAIETHHEFGILVGMHHIPHFSFSIAYATFFSQFVIRMHLHRKPVVGIDNLQQQRELFAIFVEHGLAHQVAHEGLHEVIDFVALEIAIGHYALLVPKSREQPGLAAIGQRAVVHAKHFLDFSPAPNLILEDGFEFHGIEYCLHRALKFRGQR